MAAEQMDHVLEANSLKLTPLAAPVAFAIDINLNANANEVYNTMQHTDSQRHRSYSSKRIANIAVVVSLFPPSSFAEMLVQKVITASLAQSASHLWPPVLSPF